MWHMVLYVSLVQHLIANWLPLLHSETGFRIVLLNRSEARYLLLGLMFEESSPNVLGRKKNIMCIYIDIWQLINAKWHQFAYISSLDSFFDTVSFNFSTLGETSSNVFVKRLMLIHIHQAADYGTIVSIVPIRKLLPFLCFDTWYIFGVFYFFNS